MEAAGGNLTVTAIAVKVVAAALRRFPQFNASIDLAADEIILKKYVNIGVAVDTDRGLLVPVDSRRRHEEHRPAVGRARRSCRRRRATRKISLEEMQGGCFSISNLGGIGGTYFTPIVNAPEVAILGISRARMEPVYQKESGQFVPRFMLPLSLSYDHRVDRRRRRHPLPALGRRRRWSSRSCSRFKDERLPRRPVGQEDTKTRRHRRPCLHLRDLRVFVADLSLTMISSPTRRRRRGPGGYAAAFLAADLGLSVALVDPEANPGGVCVYRGCIPSKALLHVAKLIDESRHAKAWGVEFGEPKIDLAKLRDFKDNVVKKNTGGTGQLVKARKIQYLQGLAEIVDAHNLRVKLIAGGEEQVQFEHAILATGSTPAIPPTLKVDDPRVMDSTARARSAGHPEVAARRRRRLHRPRARHGLRRRSAAPSPWSR